MPNVKSPAKSGARKQEKAKRVKKSPVSRKNVKAKPYGKIKSKEAYELTMNEIDNLMKLGEDNLTNSQLQRLRILSEAAEIFEDTNDPLPLPDSLTAIIRMRMYQMQLNQSFVAKLLGVSDAKFSMIMNGRQKPDIYFIKAVHVKLKVDANRILQAI